MAIENALGDVGQRRASEGQGGERIRREVEGDGEDELER